MYEVGRKPTKNQAYARVICHIAVKERGLSIEALSETEIEHLADDALRRYPKICDARFCKMAIGRVRVFQRSCDRDYSSSYAEMFPLVRIGFHSPHQELLSTSGYLHKFAV